MTQLRNANILIYFRVLYQSEKDYSIIKILGQADNLKLNLLWIQNLLKRSHYLSYVKFLSLSV